MGADLTIEKTGRRFRDAYNAYNVWWCLDMSYWQIFKKGRLTPKQVISIYEQLKEIPFNDNIIKNYLKFNEIADSQSDAIKFFKQKYTDMMNFWKEAVDNKSAMSGSV